MADNGAGGRGSASGKRTGTKASKAALKIRGKASHRSQRRTRRALEPFLNRNARIPAHVYLAEVVKVEGSHMDVLTKSGHQEKVRISGSASVPRVVAHKMAGSEHEKMYVIVDGGDVVGHVPADDVAQAKRKVGWPKRGNDDLFNRGSGSGSRSGSGKRLSVIHEGNENNRTRRRSRR
jgi:hypothetical protein